ncbi:flippase [Saprospiraceae bacterium]|nr:flippase [Saprospiraceae bacterium]
MSSLNKFALFKSTSIYLVANLLYSSIPFILIPILTRHIGPMEYGILAIATILVTFISPFIGLSVHGALTRRYFSETEEEFKKYLANILIIIFGNTVLCLIFLAMFGSHISKLFEISNSILYQIVFIAFSQFIFTILLTLLQVKEKPKQYGAFQITSSLLNFGLSYIFIVTLGMGWEGRFSAWVISSGLFALLAIILIMYYEQIKLRVSKIHIKKILAFSLPLIPHTIGGLVIALSDRLIIQQVLGLTETGIYTIAFQLSSVLGLVFSAFNRAYIPWMFNRLNKEDEELNLNLITIVYYLMFATIVIVILGYFVSMFAFNIVIGEEYMEASKYLFWLLLSFGFNGMYYLVSNYVFYANKTNYLAISTFIVAVLNVPICYFMTKYYGLMGAAQSTALSWFLLFVFTWFLSNKVYPMPWGKGLKRALSFSKV